MTGDQIDMLKRSSGKTVELVCTDAEVVHARIISVSEEQKDVVYDLVSSNIPQRYCDRKGNEAFLTPFEEIDSVRLLTE
jgi:hypothetical protein